VIYHVLSEMEAFSESQGGALSRWVANVARDQRNMVVCPSADESWKFPKEQIIYISRWKYYRIFKIRRWPSVLRRAMIKWIFSALIADLKQGDVVWFHNRAQYAACLRSHLDSIGVKTVLHLQNSFSRDTRAEEFIELARMPIVYCSKFLAAEAQLAHPELAHRSRVIYNGANERLFYPRQKGDGAGVRTGATVLYVGRLVSPKGVHVLLRAMSLLQKQGVEAECRIVGASSFGGSKANSYMQELERAAPNNAHFVGYRSGEDLANEFRRADIFCCPSVWQEPFGMVNVEAMACGIPVVASNVGGIPEALESGGGILVPPDDAEALAEALVRLITNEGLRRRMGEDALKIFRRRFSWSHVRAQYLAMLEEIEGVPSEERLFGS
jgi:spore coat protein SA